MVRQRTQERIGNMEKVHYTAIVDKEIQRLLGDHQYYQENFGKHETIPIMSETTEDENYNTWVRFCFGNYDGNGWIDITYWYKYHGVFSEMACGEPAFNDGSTDTYEGDDIEITVTLKFGDE